jgi:hypothetical protein
MPQAIKYETTKIDPTQSASEVATLVQRFGASRFELRWNEVNELSGIRFSLRVNGVGEVPVRIDARTVRIEEIVHAAHRSWSVAECREQALRIAWRHLRDLTEQLLLAVQLGLKDVGAAFMDGVEVWDDRAGETVTVAEYLTRYASLSAGDNGLRLLPTPRS